MTPHEWRPVPATRFRSKPITVLSFMPPGSHLTASTYCCDHAGTPNALLKTIHQDTRGPRRPGVATPAIATATIKHIPRDSHTHAHARHDAPSILPNYTRVPATHAVPVQTPSYSSFIHHDPCFTAHSKHITLCPRVNAKRTLTAIHGDCDGPTLTTPLPRPLPPRSKPHLTVPSSIMPPS
jgi:hypothetical protein